MRCTSPAVAPPGGLHRGQMADRQHDRWQTGSTLARRAAPRARVTDSTTGMAMGMPPTMMTSLLVSVGHSSVRTNENRAH